MNSFKPSPTKPIYVRSLHTYYSNRSRPTALQPKQIALCLLQGSVEDALAVSFVERLVGAISVTEHETGRVSEKLFTVAVKMVRDVDLAVAKVNSCRSTDSESNSYVLTGFRIR